MKHIVLFICFLFILSTAVFASECVISSSCAQAEDINTILASRWPWRSGPLHYYKVYQYPKSTWQIMDKNRDYLTCDETTYPDESLNRCSPSNGKFLQTTDLWKPCITISLPKANWQQGYALYSDQWNKLEFVDYTVKCAQGSSLTHTVRSGETAYGIWLNSLEIVPESQRLTWSEFQEINNNVADLNLIYPDMTLIISKEPSEPADAPSAQLHQTWVESSETVVDNANLVESGTQKEGFLQRTINKLRSSSIFSLFVTLFSERVTTTETAADVIQNVDGPAVVTVVSPDSNEVTILQKDTSMTTSDLLASAQETMNLFNSENRNTLPCRECDSPSCDFVKCHSGNYGPFCYFTTNGECLSFVEDPPLSCEDFFSEDCAFMPSCTLVNGKCTGFMDNPSTDVVISGIMFLERPDNDFGGADYCSSSLFSTVKKLCAWGEGLCNSHDECSNPSDGLEYKYPVDVSDLKKNKCRPSSVGNICCPEGYDIQKCVKAFNEKKQIETSHPKLECLGIPAQYLAVYNQYQDAIRDAAVGTGLDTQVEVSEALIAAVISKESSWVFDAVSPCGAAGFGQLIPQTARSSGLYVPDYEQEWCPNQQTTTCKIRGKVTKVSACNKCNLDRCKQSIDERFYPKKNIYAIAFVLNNAIEQCGTIESGIKSYGSGSCGVDVVPGYYASLNNLYEKWKQCLSPIV